MLKIIAYLKIIFTTMSLKTFLMKKMIKSQMKGVPDSEIDKVITMVEKNPELFNTIAKEIEALVKSGRDQMSASMEVMRKYQSDLQKLQ
jgi:hypothetical protein